MWLRRLQEAPIPSVLHRLEYLFTFTEILFQISCRFFARYDVYNPNNKVNTNVYKSYSGNTSNYNDNSFHTTYNQNIATPTVTYTTTGDQTYKQNFITAGLDWKPTNRVHFMPNVWYNSYKSQIADNKDYDLVFQAYFLLLFRKEL